MKNFYEVLQMSDGGRIALHGWTGGGGDVVYICHGMKEYAERYASFAERLVNDGFDVYAHDQRGHGKTASLGGMLGFLSDKSGFDRVVDDLHEILVDFRSKFIGRKIYLVAHSFGSIVAQALVQRYPLSADALVLVGTVAVRRMFERFSLAITNIFRVLQGPAHRSLTLDKTAFFGYNNRIVSAASKNSWVCSDDAVVEAYDKDSLCSFVPTVGFYCDLSYGLVDIHKEKNMSRIARELPIFFIAGTDDPVGAYGEGVEKLYEEYKRIGLNVELRLYQGERHELINGVKRDEVYADVLAFLRKHKLAGKTLT